MSTHRATTVKPDAALAALTLDAGEARRLASDDPDALRQYILRAKAQAARSEAHVADARDLLRNAATREAKTRWQKQIDVHRARVEACRGMALGYADLLAEVQR